MIVAAGPHMLGLLRDVLGAPLRAVLIGEIDKDFTHQSTDALLAKVNTIIAT